jgi:hypothetical protein
MFLLFFFSLSLTLLLFFLFLLSPLLSFPPFYIPFFSLTNSIPDFSSLVAALSLCLFISYSLFLKPIFLSHSVYLIFTSSVSMILLLHISAPSERLEGMNLTHKPGVSACL